MAKANESDKREISDTCLSELSVLISRNVITNMLMVLILHVSQLNLTGFTVTCLQIKLWRTRVANPLQVLRFEILESEI